MNAMDKPADINGSAVPVRSCGQCVNAHVASRNLNDPLECRFGPPGMMAAGGNGRVTFVTMYPRVQRGTPACASGFALKPSLQE